MKKLAIFVIFGLLTIECNSQYLVDNFRYTPKGKEHKIPESVKIIGIYAGSILLDAVGDGLNDEGEKTWGHACNAASVGLLLASPFVIDYDKSKWGYYLASYVSLRISFFDPTYNLTRGLPVTYIGGTSLWDKSLKHMAPPDGFMTARSLSLILGISIPINELTPSRRLVKGMRPNK